MPRLPSPRDLSLFLATFGLFLFLALRENLPEVSAWNLHFGGEYGNIAASLARGEGYGNPFELDGQPHQTGPTAWMPPLYTYLMGLLFIAFGAKSAGAAWALLLLKSLALAAAFVLLFRLGLLTSRSNWPYLLLPIYLFHLRIAYHSFFQFMHDVWLVMLVLTVLVYLYVRDATQRRSLGLAWGLLGGVSALVSPAAGLLFLTLTLAPLTPTPVKRRLLLCLLAFAVTVPWTTRNLITFGELIPGKSNLFFDLYQANVLDDDGVLTKSTFDDFHPHNNPDSLGEYASLGETRFMKRCRGDFLEYLSDDPAGFLRRVWNRFLAATLKFPVFLGDWETAGWTGRVKVVVYTFPFLLGLYLSLAGSARERRLARLLMICAGVFLLPYIVVAYYQRYRLPLTTVFCLIEFQFLLHLAGFVPRDRLARLAGRTRDWLLREFDLRGREPGEPRRR